MNLRNRIVTIISYLNTDWKRKLIKSCKTFKGKYGIEIGGPSPALFSLKGLFPIYVYAKQIDGLNFSNNTVWEGKLREGKTFNYFQKKTGHQYIKEATDLNGVENDKYDFVLSSHNLEHIANPLKALLEWKRVLKTSGKLILILPDKTKTFDHRRNYTAFQHLVDDLKYSVDEYDETHFKEITELIDLKNEPKKDRELFTERLAKNFVTRIAHHHVFSFDLINKILDFAGFETIYQQACPPFHLVTIAKRNI